ncbi:MAG: CRISPR-associated endonuclease Cas3'' [Sediminibacterium sp.]
MTTLLANRQGQTLKNHTKSVLLMVEQVWFKLYGTKTPEALRFGALLHDTGKAIKSFQDNLNTVKTKQKGVYEGLYHEEISLVMVLKYLSSIGVSESDIDIIAHLVYNHHANAVGKDFERFRPEYKNIIETLTEEDENSVVEFIRNELGLDISSNNKEQGEIPNYHPIFSDFKHDNIKQLDRLSTHCLKDFYLSILIDCDRKISSLEKEVVETIANGDTEIFKTNSVLVDYFDKLLRNPFGGSNVVFPEKYDIKRLERQTMVAESSTAVTTSIINEPAGGGKTLISLLYAIKLKRRVVLILPRNNPAKSLFEDVVETLKDLGFGHISVELFLGGERKDSVNANEEILSSDVIITNIHNVLNSLTKNDIADRRLFFYTSTMIFDEYHELMQDNAISSLFYRLILSRHLYSNSKSMMLSATPEVIPSLIEVFDDKNLKYFPEKFKHYENFNKNPIQVKMLSDFPEQLEPGSCCLTNSVSEANA